MDRSVVGGGGLVAVAAHALARAGVVVDGQRIAGQERAREDR